MLRPNEIPRYSRVREPRKARDCAILHGGHGGTSRESEDTSTRAAVEHRYGDHRLRVLPGVAGAAEGLGVGDLCPPRTPAPRRDRARAERFPFPQRRHGFPYASQMASDSSAARSSLALNFRALRRANHAASLRGFSLRQRFRFERRKVLRCSVWSRWRSYSLSRGRFVWRGLHPRES